MWPVFNFVCMCVFGPHLRLYNISHVCKSKTCLVCLKHDYVSVTHSANFDCRIAVF